MPIFLGEFRWSNKNKICVVSVIGVADPLPSLDVRETQVVTGTEK